MGTTAYGNRLLDGDGHHRELLMRRAADYRWLRSREAVGEKSERKCVCDVKRRGERKWRWKVNKRQ